MVAVAWAAVGLLAVALGFLVAAFFQLGGRIDQLGARLAGRIDQLAARLHAMNARLDAHLERHAS
jgi:hypothetical protein